MLIILLIILLILISLIIIYNGLIINNYCRSVNNYFRRANNKCIHGGNLQNNYDLAKQLVDQFDYTKEEKELILSISKESQKLNPWNDLVNLIQYRETRIKDIGKNRFPQKYLSHNCYFRKFLISQVFVLTRFYKKGAVILYIGASNAIFLPYLISLFPHHIWHIYYDINLSYEFPHELLELNQIHLYHKELTIEDAKNWHNKIDVVISHHRPSIHNLKNTKNINGLELNLEFDKKIFKELINQSNIIKEIEPKLGASLKFMLPYVDSSDRSNIEIIQGKILWLPWSKPTSTDSTLIIEASDAKKNSSNMFINPKILEDSYATHNMIYKSWAYYETPNNVHSNKINGYDNCFDCTFEANVWQNYLNIFKDTNLHIHDIMNSVSNKFEPLINIVKKTDMHGRHTKLSPAERINYLIEHKYIKIENIAEIQKQYKSILYDNAQKYDEFSEDANQQMTIENTTTNAINTHFLHNFKNNLILAKKLLETKFKNMYTEREQKYILTVSSKEWPLPSIWNSLKFYIPYRGNKGGALAHNIVYSHLGQRKLFMAELQVLTRYLKSATDSAIVLYAGAAPSIHLPLLYQLFPNVIWHLYDPAKFAIKESHNAKIYNEFFTHETAK